MDSLSRDASRLGFRLNGRDRSLNVRGAPDCAVRRAALFKYGGERRSAVYARTEFDSRALSCGTNSFYIAEAEESADCVCSVDDERAIAWRILGFGCSW